MKAQNRDQYIKAWESHINELIHPCLESGMSIDEWTARKYELMAVVEKAADESFAEEIAK